MGGGKRVLENFADRQCPWRQNDQAALGYLQRSAETETRAAPDRPTVHRRMRRGVDRSGQFRYPGRSGATRSRARSGGGEPAGRRGAGDRARNRTKLRIRTLELIELLPRREQFLLLE
jgi:hypothetical protein